jgi:spore coat protein E
MSGTDKDLQCRELIAKAVCGKGHKFSTTTHTIIPSQTPSTILGCWIINTNFTFLQIKIIREWSVFSWI